MANVRRAAFDRYFAYESCRQRKVLQIGWVMLRYYLDTNVIVMILEKRTYELKSNVLELINDYSTLLYVSSDVVHETIHLLQIGRVKTPKREPLSAADFRNWLDVMGIKTVYVNELHMQAYSELPVVDGHTDPTDRMIIAQSVTDHIPLISSDLRFPAYKKHGLEHIPSR